MSRNVYHAGKPGRPMCGSTGALGGYHAVTVGADDWNLLPESQRCAKCIACLKAAKSRKQRIAA